jgi:N-acetylmuramic acid 6-phosphate (MurNAc-6-P) etherase
MRSIGYLAACSRKVLEVLVGFVWLSVVVQVTQKGAVLFLLGAVDSAAKIGMVCVGTSPDEASAIRERVTAKLCSLALESGSKL